ncbi:sodium/hydrogen exchanger 6 [Tanacetum coccineum]
MDINSFDLHFTWNQKPQGQGGVLRKIDRVMGNLGCVDTFLGLYALFQPYRNSDHSLAILKVLKLLKDQGNLHNHVADLRAELDIVKKVLDYDPFNNQLRDEEVVYLRAFNEATLDEERYLQQKAKIEWLRVGDSNSAYFHKVIKGRNSRSRIEVIKNTNGFIHDGDQVPNIFVAHYNQFLGTLGEAIPLDLPSLYLKVLDPNKAAHMVHPVLDEEVKQVRFSIRNNKAPEPDGHTSKFFKEAWDIVGGDVYKAIRKFFTSGKLLKEINHIVIALFPKVKTPSQINDYQPISCCNVLYKFISKIITNRIKEALNEIVSDNQSAFVSGSRIAGNIHITQKLMHNYHLDRGPPRCAFKVDMQKAYDTVDWNFLRSILLGFGFHMVMVNCIMEYVTKEMLSQPSLFIDTLDEFMLVSGLVPSIPKSKAYFCNVLNHVKLSILNVMPFVEGEMKKGKAKVAWNIVCLPKQESGLDIFYANSWMWPQSWHDRAPNLNLCIIPNLTPDRDDVLVKRVQAHCNLLTILTDPSGVYQLVSEHFPGRARQANQFSRLAKVEFPKFFGEDVLGWIFKCDQFFLIDNTTEEDKGKIIFVHLFDKALLWHRQLIKSKRENISWNEYKDAITLRFGSVYDDLMASLKNAKYDKYAKEYLYTFDNLLSRVEDFQWQLYGHTFTSDVMILPLGGCDMVLGIQWLSTLCDIRWNFQQLKMEFLYNNKRVCLRGTNKSITHWLDSRKQIARMETMGGVELMMMTIYPNTKLHLMTMEEIMPIKAKVEPRLPEVIDAHAKPVNIRPYRHPPVQKDAIEAMVRELLDFGVIKHSQSSFASTVVMVKKKDNSWRIAVIFTKLDLRSGYHQIRMYEDDIAKTTFRTHEGHYEFLVMPFGLTNAPSTFQAFMNDVFREYLRKFTLVFFDDILIYSKSLEDHIQHLITIHSIMKNHSLYDKESKYVFA